MMQPNALVELVADGDHKTVEEAWMALIEAGTTTVDELILYDVVLQALVRANGTARAQELAWAAVESFSGRHGAAEALRMATPFLLAVGEGDELRSQVCELYRGAYGDREGMEALLAEAGVGGGRPVRRALRTMDVCLRVSEGDFLVSRDEDVAARIDRIQRPAWTFTITAVDGAETLGAVHLADRFERAGADDFRVMRQFEPQRLSERLRADPVGVLMDLCRQRGGSIDSDTIESVLTAGLLEPDEWKRWWTKARTALRRCAHIEMEGRSPVYLRYVNKPVALEDDVRVELGRLREPLAQLAVIEKYLRECKMRGQQPGKTLLEEWVDRFMQRAKEGVAQDDVSAGTCWLVARRIAAIGELEDKGRAASEGVVALFRSAADPAAIPAAIDNEALQALACETLVEARPDDWPQRLLERLPDLTQSVCDWAAGRLVAAGRGRDDFEPVVQRILASPIVHFQALLWLWSGPSEAAVLSEVNPVTVLSRILRALEDARRSDATPKETVRTMGQRARSALSARKFQRFIQCLETMQPDMANAVRTQLRQAESLGRAARDDLLNRLQERFPPTHTETARPPWARDDVLYVTEAGMARKHAQIDELVNVKMRENAAAIGRAAERGDLSENSEYKFALEERDLLRARLAQMNAEMAKAVVIRADEVPTDHVAIGTRTTFRGLDDGAAYDLTLVGPWDADGEKRWLNYLAPLPQRILGKRVGDVVEFEHGDIAGRYEIVAIENVLQNSS